MSGGPSRDRDIGRKWESGASKKRRKAETVMSNQTLSSSMMKYLSKKPCSEVTSFESDESVVQIAEPASESCGSAVIQVSELNKEFESENICETENQEETIHLRRESFVDLDPGKWVFPITDLQRHDLIQNGPYQNLEISDEEYPKDASKRHFSKFHFTRKLSNDETQHRRWLVYSITQDKVYCFPCRLFSHLQTQMVQGGCCDWKDLSRILQRHEQSPGHMGCMFKWMEFHKGIKHGKTIDMENERLIRESQKYWYNLFERLIDIINYLASYNLAFRGHRESYKLDYSGNSGNFMDLFKLLSKYDLTLREHLQRMNEKRLAQHYLSPDIQNELITLMSQSVIEEIIQRVKQAKYYAFMLDCTRDVSRVEQMSIILRFCNSSTGEIEEHFIEFIAVAETTGEYLTNSILQELEKNGLDIQNCRGQGYDNGANMVGINKGVKTRILNINPRAFFTPCGCHSWNLLLIDAANSSITAKTFFGFINKIYVLFSASSKRWELVKSKLKLTLKALSETRWESRIAAVKAIFLQFDDVIDCVNDLKDKDKDSDTLSDCKAILNEIFTFEFVVAVHVWYEILLRVNNISKLWQSVEVNLKGAIDTLCSFCNWIQEYRNTGFEKAVAQARLFVEKSSYEIPTQFKEKRIVRKKRMFGYEHIDEPIQSAEIQFKVDFFITMIDAIIADTECRFESLNEYFKRFGFIYDMNYLKSLSKEDLQKHCNDLDTILREGENSDIQPFELFEELQLFRSNSPDSIKDVKQLIRYILENNLQEIYPNVYITIRIMLTVPVSTASAERSFSKLKLIKNYLRSTMSQERLSALAVLSIEAEIASRLSYDSVLKKFSEAKSRKVRIL